MSEQRFHLAFHFLKDETAAAARLLEEQNAPDVAAFLSKAPSSTVVEVLRSMVPDYAAAVLIEADKESVTAWMLALETPALCAILRYLDESAVNALLALLPLKRQAASQLLLSYRADMVGAWAETDVPVATDHMDAGELTKRLRRRQYRDNRLIVVLNEERHPVGVIHPGDLFQANEGLPIIQLMRPHGTTLRGRVTLSTAIKQSLWQEQDYAVIVNRHQQWVGLLWHSCLKQQLHLQVTHPSLSQEPQYALNQVLQAHGDSMKALLHAVHDGLKS
ncbi:MAG: CBS domain-containing protein [Salinisphaeraceae bacterium]|nr:CBS domain-containing protein [Salinisphaeraceae bacterium]